MSDSHPPFPLAGLHRDANFLVELLVDLKVPYVYEKSFRMGRASLLTNRLPLDFDPSAVPGGFQGIFEHFSRRIPMPPQCLEMLRDNLNAAHGVLLGFEENETACLHKICIRAGRARRTNRMVRGA